MHADGEVVGTTTNLTKEQLKAESQVRFQQKVMPQIQSRVRGVSSQEIDEHFRSREYQQLNDLLAQQTHVLLVKHGIGGAHTGPPPQPVSPAQWSSVEQQHLQMAVSKGVPPADLQKKQAQHHANAQAIWDHVFEQGLQEARGKGASEAQLNAFRNDPQLNELKNKFTQGIAGLVAEHFYTIHIKDGRIASIHREGANPS